MKEKFIKFGKGCKAFGNALGNGLMGLISQRGQLQAIKEAAREENAKRARQRTQQKVDAEQLKWRHFKVGNYVSQVTNVGQQNRLAKLGRILAVHQEKESTPTKILKQIRVKWETAYSVKVPHNGDRYVLENASTNVGCAALREDAHVKGFDGIGQICTRFRPEDICTYTRTNLTSLRFQPRRTPGGNVIQWVNQKALRNGLRGEGWQTSLATVNGEWWKTM
jgi:hypothetical protein